jgi:8-oxo-dGTP diphosphatase
MDGERVTPVPTVDIIIEIDGKVLLIERKHPPAGWAIPGGHVDAGESLADAARREAREETSLEVTLTEQFFTYGAPGRDPRKPTISTVYLAKASGTPRAADDAADVRLIGPGDELPPLAFDHAAILADYRTYRATGRRPPVER